MAKPFKNSLNFSELIDLSEISLDIIFPSTPIAATTAIAVKLVLVMSTCKFCLRAGLSSREHCFVNKDDVVGFVIDPIDYYRKAWPYLFRL